MQITRKYWILVLAVVAVSVQQITSKPCEGLMADKCENCNDENKCLNECKQGYFIDPVEDRATGAECSACGTHCLKCSGKRVCQECSPGFLNYPNECIRCDVGCSSCEGKPSQCVNCIGGYLLDTEKECYYRYTLVILICSAVGVFIFFSMLCKCLVNVNKPERQSMKAMRGPGESHESILGDEFKKDPTIISDVTGIGKQYEVDQDLSVVEESHVGGAGHDDSIHLDEFNSRRGSNIDDRRMSIDDRKPKQPRNDVGQRATVPNNFS